MTFRDRLEELFDEQDRLIAEIGRLKGLVKYHCEEQMKGWKQERVYKALISELCDALEQQSSWSTKVELIQRAREMTRDEKTV